jgi:hypothetical protein
LARDRTLGAAAALVVHLALGLLLAFDVGQGARLFGAQDAGPKTLVLNIELAPPRPRQRPAPSTPEASLSSRPRPAAPLSRSIAQRAPRPAPATISRPAGPDTSEPNPAEPAPNAGVIQALRGSVGCDRRSLVRLTAEESERCNQRNIRLGAGAQETDINLSASARAEFDLALKENHSPGHIPLIGCFATFGLGKVTWYHPSHGVRLGPLPCYIATSHAVMLPDKEPAKGF